MKLMSNELFKAVRYALYAGATAAIGLSAAPVFAQDTGSDQDSQKLETITVTGSRIRKADVETAQPIVVMDRAAIEKQGFNSVADILQNMPEAGTPPISRSEVLASGEAVGGYYISLRNLGNNRTLVLINGKRLGSTTGGDQDLSQIPIAAIDRIEVLKDGASAIYGADAIAGVVNIITRKNYDGAEASAYVGQYDDDDGAIQTYSMTFGAHSDRGSITLSAEYSKEDPVWAKDRWFSRYGATTRHPDDNLTVVSQWGSFYLPTDPRFAACRAESGFGGRCSLNPGGDPFNPADWHGTNSQGGNDDLTNSNEEMMLRTGIQRRSLYANAEYNIFDNVRFSTDLLYNHRETVQQVAGYPLQLRGFRYANPQADGISPYSWYNPVGFWHNPAFDATRPASDYTIGTPTRVAYRRGWEVPRVTNSQLTTYRFGGTFDGSFELGDHTWNWDVGGYFNRGDSLKVNRGDFSLIAVNRAIGPSFLNAATGRVECGTPTAPIPYGTAPGSCIPWNPLIPAGSTGPGALQNNAALQQYLFPYYNSTGQVTTHDYSANITGSIFTLPAGDLAVAAGYEYRNEKGNFIPDAFSQAGISTNLASGPTRGAYNVKEYYLEVDVPVLRDMFLARELSFNVAGRYSKYSSFGDTTNGKFSLTWRPIDDLMVRGNYAQGFRAPTIADLYGGISGTFDYYTDPCDPNREAGPNAAVSARCRSGFGGQPGVPANFHQTNQSGVPCTVFPCQTATQFFAGASPTLQPETSTTKTLGVVYSPHWVEGLDLSLDWYRIHINGAMRGDSVTSMLRDCYVLGVASRCSSQLFQRDPTTGVLSYALRGLKNAGWVDTEGYDLGVNYRLPEFSFGRFAIHWNTTYVSKLNSKADNQPTTPIDPSNSFGGDFRIRSNASLEWTLGDFGATWMTRYYSSMKEECSYDDECNLPNYVSNGVATPLNRVGSSVFHDVQARWNAPWNATVSVGVNNLFKHWAGPSYSGPNSQYSYYGGFDIGRFYYLRYDQKF